VYLEIIRRHKNVENISIAIVKFAPDFDVSVHRESELLRRPKSFCVVNSHLSTPNTLYIKHMLIVSVNKCEVELVLWLETGQRVDELEPFGWRIPQHPEGLPLNR